MKRALLITIVFILFIFFQHKGVAQWIKANGIESGNTYALTSDGTNLFAGVYGTGLFRSTDNGTNWTNIVSPVTDAYSLATIGSNLFAGSIGTFGSVFRSLDSGTTWTQVLTTLGAPCFGVMGSTIFSGPCGGGPLRRSTDYGDNWEPVNNGITMSWVMAYGTYNSEIFAATDYGHLFQSVDLGDHWTETGYSGSTIIAILVNASAIYVGTQTEGTVLGSVYYSSDEGQNWTNMGFDNLGLSGCNITSILSIGDKIFVGTNGYGVFLYSNDEPNWTNVGLESKAAWQIIIVGDEMIAGTSSGVWKRPLSEMITAVNDKQQLPIDYILSQNYPNPFNPSTVITYALPQSGFVILKVYDIIGNELVTLVNENKSEGIHTVSFNAANLPSAVYIYKLQASSFVQAKKMTLMK